MHRYIQLTDIRPGDRLSWRNPLGGSGEAPIVEGVANGRVQLSGGRFDMSLDRLREIGATARRVVSQ